MDNFVSPIILRLLENIDQGMLARVLLDNVDLIGLLSGDEDLSKALELVDKLDVTKYMAEKKYIDYIIDEVIRVNRPDLYVVIYYYPRIREWIYDNAARLAEHVSGGRGGAGEGV